MFMIVVPSILGTTMARAKGKKSRATSASANAAEPEAAEIAEGIEEAARIAPAVLDELLTLQLLVAWAGEGATDPPRLRWWRTSLCDELGGEDLFARLTPRTWKWAVLEAARVAAGAADAEMRSHAADHDRLVSLFHFGFAIDEQLEDRLAELKRHVPEPVEALPELAPIYSAWDPDAFRARLRALAEVSTAPSSLGLRLEGEMPARPEVAARMLAAALAADSDRYPAPHWKVAA